MAEGRRALITPDGWFDWAIRHPGPDAKTGYGGQKNSRPEGVVYHSAEGTALSLLNLVASLNREASWTASNMKNGDFYQHYPITRIVWTNGSKLANVKFRGIESEGVAGEPLTQAQTDNLIRVAADMRDFFGWPGFRRGIEAWEHNQMTAFGAAATSCPSGRIPWNDILIGLEDDVTPEEVRQAMKDVLKDKTAFPELGGKSVVEHIQAADDYTLRSIGAALTLAAEDLKAHQ